MTDLSCSVCENSSGNSRFTAREMMFGRRDEFLYMECGQCGCVALQDVPRDLSSYYPADYYSQQPTLYPRSGLRHFIRRQRALYCLHGKNPLGWLVTKRYGRPAADIFGSPDYYKWLKTCGVALTSRIADVGCGAGSLLYRLHDDGFTDLTGIDPFVDKTQQIAQGFRILKQDIYSVDERFDLVMLHHTFEHMPEPARALRHLYTLLNPRCFLLIRIPVASSFAFRKYRQHWAQLDAPRHLLLHTLASMKMLAQQSGFLFQDVVFDSSDFQFWASEQYARDIPLKDKRSYNVNPAESVFSKEDIVGYQTAADQLNRDQDGDSACFYFYKP